MHLRDQCLLNSYHSVKIAWGRRIPCSCFTVGSISFSGAISSIPQNFPAPSSAKKTAFSSKTSLASESTCFPQIPFFPAVSPHWAMQASPPSWPGRSVPILLRFRFPIRSYHRLSCRADPIRKSIWSRPFDPGSCPRAWP